MADFSSFLKKNVIPVENEKFAVSNRFVNPKTGEIEKWEIRAIDPKTDALLRNECTKKVPISGKRNQFTKELDTDLYMIKLAARCTVYPDLFDAALQDDYGVKKPEDLLSALLMSGEFTNYITKVSEINGFDISQDDLVEEAKN